MNHTSESYTAEDHAASEPDFYGKWVSVDSELPNEGQQVLTADKGGRVYHCTKKGNRFKLMFHCDDHHPVTHWMPLPTAPNT
jgi:hypothetical protein